MKLIVAVADLSCGHANQNMVDAYLWTEVVEGFSMHELELTIQDVINEIKDRTERTA